MKKKLNIWSVSHYACTPEMPGIQRAYQYACSFAALGHNVTLWRSSYNNLSKKDSIADDRAFDISKSDNLSIISLKTLPQYKKNDYKRFLNMLHFGYSLLKVSKNLSPPPDVVIAAYPSPFAALAGFLTAKRYDAKFIMEIGDLWPQCWVERKAFSRYHPFVLLLYAVEKYLYRRTSVFISSLPFVNEYLIERGANPQKYFWIPNPIQFELFKNTVNNEDLPEDVIKIINDIKSERSADKLVVVYIGGIGVGNRVDCIVESARILKDRGENNISFFIIGGGHSKEKIINYVEQNKLDLVKVLQPIPKKAVPSVLMSADVGIMCLNNNTIYRYGVNLNKIYDYLAAGLPVVFSADVRNNLINDYDAGITVPPSDPATIASALLKVKAMSSEERADMGKRGHAGVADNFSIQILSKKYIDIIDNLYS